MADQYWSSLPRDILVLILEKLSLLDHLSIEAVCVSWSLAVRDRHSRPTIQSPWLLHTPSSSSVCFLSLSDNNINNNKKKKLYITSPTISSRLRHKLCIGSSPNGWLLTLDPSLINPLTGSHVPLPPIPAISKAVVSSSFTTVAAIHGVTRLSYTKPGDTQWSPLDSPHPFQDLIFYGGLLYTLSHTGLIESWDLHSPSPEATLVVDATPGERWLRREGNRFHKYLVEVGGDLVQVWRERLFTVDEQRITRFRVFTLNEKRSRWVGSKGLPEHAVFVGHNSSLALSVREFPELRGNCVYFTDDLPEDVGRGPNQALDCGVYDLVDGSIDRFNLPELMFGWPAPIWFTPSLQ